jgi:hypothetical protein
MTSRIQHHLFDRSTLFGCHLVDPRQDDLRRDVRRLDGPAALRVEVGRRHRQEQRADGNDRVLQQAPAFPVDERREVRARQPGHQPQQLVPGAGLPHPRDGAPSHVMKANIKRAKSLEWRPKDRRRRAPARCAVGPAAGTDRSPGEPTSSRRRQPDPQFARGRVRSIGDTGRRIHRRGSERCPALRPGLGASGCDESPSPVAAVAAGGLAGEGLVFAVFHRIDGSLPEWLSASSPQRGLGSSRTEGTRTGRSNPALTPQFTWVVNREAGDVATLARDSAQFEPRRAVGADHSSGLWAWRGDHDEPATHGRNEGWRI